MAARSNAPGIAVQALWFGLLTGLCEAALTGIKARVLGRFVRMPPDIAWLAPLADGAAFLTIGLALIGASRVWRPLGEPRVATGVFAFLAFLSLLFMYYPLQVYAKVLLAMGLALQSVRVASWWPALFERAVRLGVIAMTVLIVVAAILIRVGPSLAYQHHVDGLPAATAGSPNVLLIVWDTVRAKNLSLYGYGRRTTPHLEQWARTAAVFDRASSASPWTLPSHASMMTGRWPQELSASWEQALDGQHRTLAEVLSGRGYLTAGFIANTYYCGHELGLARGFAHYEDYVVSPQELLISSTLLRVLANSGVVRRLTGYADNIPRRSASAIGDQFLAWQSAAGPRPFFAFLNFFDAHETYLPPPPFAGAFGPGPPTWSPAIVQDVRRSLRRDWPERPAVEIQGEINMYDAAIAYLDDQLNRLLSELQARGVLNNTIVIVTSDHGEQFGEHRLFLHGNSLYQPLLHVPLIIRYPRHVPEGRRIVSRVTLRDLPATILDLAALPETSSLPGVSLARYWTGAPRTEDSSVDPTIAEVREADWAKQSSPWYPVAKGDMESVTDDTYHYIKNGDGREELYAIAVDPEEREDLSTRDESQPILERYRKTLRTSLAPERR